MIPLDWTWKSCLGAAILIILLFGLCYGGGFYLLRPVVGQLFPQLTNDNANVLTFVIVFVVLGISGGVSASRRNRE